MPIANYGTRDEEGFELTESRDLIAVIDDGFDIDHSEVSWPGKVVASFDALSGSSDPRPKDLYPDYPDDHGMACACASGIDGAIGVAPDDGIWTTDRSGSNRYNPGNVHNGDANGNYTNSFGGTSSACAGVAGVVALMLSVNPGLTPPEIKDLLRQSCDRVDPDGGQYDSDSHSESYGYGRICAHHAVEMAIPTLSARLEIVRDVGSIIRFGLQITLQSSEQQSIRLARYSKRDGAQSIQRSMPLARFQRPYVS